MKGRYFIVGGLDIIRSVMSLYLDFFKFCVWIVKVLCLFGLSAIRN